MKAAKDEYKRQLQITLQKQEQFLIDNPEIGKWVKTKKNLFRLLAGYLIFQTVINIIVLVMDQRLTVSELSKSIFLMLISQLWIALFMNSIGGWRINLILYFLAEINLFALVRNGTIIIMLESASYLPYLPFIDALAYGILMLTYILTPFLLLATAIYLTAFSNHRKLSEQAKEMYKETFLELLDTIKK